MIKTFKLERGRISKFLLFVLFVSALVWYIGEKRSEFLKGPVTKPMVAPSAPKVQKPDTDYFIDSKIERERSKSQELERLREVIASKDADVGTRREASARFLSLSREAARETEIEQLVKAKGYEDCLAFCGSQGTVVVIKSAQVTQSDVAKIAEIVAQVAGQRPENLKVISRQ